MAGFGWILLPWVSYNPLHGGDNYLTVNRGLFFTTSYLHRFLGSWGGYAARTLRTIGRMAGRTCYHCKQWVEEGELHDCWTTTEAALTEGLSEDLREAWERLRETAAAFGEQRIDASHKSIMFSRTSCYFFVRPKRSVLEVCVFLGRALKAPQVRRVDSASKSKVVHILHIKHRDEVEAPITDWLKEAYDFSGRTSR